MLHIDNKKQRFDHAVDVKFDCDDLVHRDEHAHKLNWHTKLEQHLQEHAELGVAHSRPPSWVVGRLSAEYLRNVRPNGDKESSYRSLLGPRLYGVISLIRTARSVFEKMASNGSPASGGQPSR